MGCDLLYLGVGETPGDIDVRIKEHKYSIRTGNTNNAVFKHMYDTNHNTDWQNSHIIHKCNDHKKRKVIGSIYKQKYSTFNLRGGGG